MSRVRGSALVAGLALLLVAGALLKPLPTADLTPRRAPAADYAEAVARAGALMERDTAAINPLCRTRLLTHGHRTARAVVLFHGFTNCPRQFEALGRLLHERGDNVLIPRQPRHGLADRMTEDLAGLAAPELAALADEALDIARGLGDEVVVVGLSSGGVMAAWLAQTRPDLRRAVVMAPVFGPAGPTWLTRPMANLALLLPNRFVWWDDEAKAEIVGPAHAYPRYSTRAGGEIVRLGAAVAERAARERPAAAEIAVLTLPDDPAVSNEGAAEVVRQWERHGAGVSTRELPPALSQLHDFIDPDQARQRVDIAYPIIIALIDGRDRPREAPGSPEGRPESVLSID